MGQQNSKASGGEIHNGSLPTPSPDEDEADVRMLEQPHLQHPRRLRGDVDSDVCMAGADDPIPTTEISPLGPEERVIARQRLTQLHEIYLDATGIDLTLRRIHELCSFVDRDLRWDPELICNIQRLARALGDPQEEKVTDGSMEESVADVGQEESIDGGIHADEEEKNAVKIENLQRLHATAASVLDSESLGGFSFSSSPPAPMVPGPEEYDSQIDDGLQVGNGSQFNGSFSPVDYKEESLIRDGGKPAKASASDSEVEVPSDGKTEVDISAGAGPADEPSDDEGSISGKSACSEQPETDADTDAEEEEEEEEEECEPPPKRRYNRRPQVDLSAGAQFWRPMTNLEDPARLALPQALAQLLTEPATSFFKDSYTFLYEMFNATQEQQDGQVHYANSHIYHQDVQMMFHLQERALQDRFRQMFGYIQIWYVHCANARNWDWKVAASARLYYREREAMRLYDDWVQPQLPQQQPQRGQQHQILASSSSAAPPQTPRRSARNAPASVGGLITPPRTVSRKRGRTQKPARTSPVPAPALPRPEDARRPFTHISQDEFLQFHRVAVRAGKNYAWLASQLSFGALAHLFTLLPSHNAVATKMTKIEQKKAGKGSEWARNGLNRLVELDIVGLAESSGANAKCDEVLRCMTQRYAGFGDTRDGMHLGELDDYGHPVTWPGERFGGGGEFMFGDGESVEEEGVW